MLEVNNITFSYRRKTAPVLDGFTLNLKEGCVYGLLGENGSGKSTLLNLMAGLLTPETGEVLLNGVNTRRRLPSTMREIFLVPEEFTLPSVTLREYVKINSPFYPRFSADEMERHLQLFDLSPDVNLTSLSMGTKKKAFLCFALACNTSLLLLDEPTNGLDIPGKSTFRRFIASNMTDERTIVISTHQVRDIDRIIDRITIMGSNSPLLDNAIYDITGRLKFMTTSDPELIAKALYTQDSPEGTHIILSNTDGDETPVNLELLFDFSRNCPEKITRIFTNNHDHDAI